MDTQDLQKFQIHYYFDDKSHSMNALVRNRAEKELLDAIQRISDITEQDFQIETQAYSEGGLIETLAFTTIGIAIGNFLSPAINGIIQHYFTRDKEFDNLKKQKLCQEIKGLELENEKKQFELEQLFYDKQVQRNVSSYYKKINGYAKVQSIGFKSNDFGELIVTKDHFKDFILIDDTTTIEDDDAEIKIISPVLIEGKYKWRGNYLENIIDFSMGDAKFKDDIINSKHSFSNGNTINCNLQITTTYDELGDEKRKSYSVRKVYAIKYYNETFPRLRPSGLKRKREKEQNEYKSSLFGGNE